MCVWLSLHTVTVTYLHLCSATSLASTGEGRGQLVASNSSMVGVKGQHVASQSSIAGVKGQPVASRSSLAEVKGQPVASQSSMTEDRGQLDDGSATPKEEVNGTC